MVAQLVQDLSNIEHEKLLHKETKVESFHTVPQAAYVVFFSLEKVTNIITNTLFLNSYNSLEVTPNTCNLTVNFIASKISIWLIERNL